MFSMRFCGLGIVDMVVIFRTYCNQKEWVQETHSPMRCSHSDPRYSHPYCPIHILVQLSHPIYERPTCLISDPARSELRQTQQHKTRFWSCLADECTQEKYSDSHYQIMYIVREHKHCPRTSVPHSQRVWSFLKTLS
jgi:hypothetical protein